MPRIAVVGSYGAGLSLRVTRMPAAGETVVGGPFEVHAGGKGSNQAIGAARLGADVALLTALGNDPFAAQARGLWEAEGIDTSKVITVGAATMVGVILVDGNGQNRIAIAPGALDLLDPATVDGFADQIAAADVCLIQLEIPVAAAVHALRVARRAGVPTVLNPAPARPLPAETLQLVDYLIPNETEAATLAGRVAPVEELGRRLAAAGARHVVVTVGERGAVVVTDAAAVQVPASPVEQVLDTTGAGDAFNAAFAVALAEGADPVEAARWGCAAGGFAVQHWGVVPGLPRRHDLDFTAVRRPEDARQPLAERL